MPQSENSYLDALGAALNSLNKLQVALQLVSTHLAAIRRQASDFDLTFDRQGVLSRVAYRHSGDVIWPTDDDGLRSLELRSNCEWLPKHLEDLWKDYPEADRALASLPAKLIEKLDALTGKPWLASVRRNCLDLILKWPGETSHQSSYAAVKVGGSVNEMLEKAAQHDPFPTWAKYDELLDEYRHDLVAIRDAVQPPKTQEPINTQVAINGGQQGQSLHALIASFITIVGKYLSTAQLIQINSQLAKPRKSLWHGSVLVENPSDVQLQKLVDLDHEKNIHAEQIELISHALIPVLQASGNDARGVLQLVHRARGGGGGPPKVAEMWEALKVDLQDISARHSSAIQQESSNFKPGKTRKRRTLDRATEARDKWIYNECVGGTLYDSIARRLAKKPKTWVRIDTKQGIRAAAERYAKRHGLPPIPSRQDQE